MSMQVDEECHDGYNSHVETFRQTEYPSLKDTIYLDHAGTTLYAKSLIERFSTDMLGNLYGNPHSASSASQNTAKQVEEARLRLLDLFNASPEDYDVVFVANATAGIKLIMEAFRDMETGFWYGHHRDAHTSLIGVREVAKEHRCFESDEAVELWLSDTQDFKTQSCPGLFAYPAQSNMNGRRLPLQWCERIRHRKNTYSLLDAAALVSTSPLDLSSTATSPDFTVMSLYKIFGFPDIGALIVRKASGGILCARKYFGGGTVDMVVSMKEQWHIKKSESLHDQIEDGTLPVHSIVALHGAMDVHRDLYGSLRRVSEHCAFLAKRLYEGLAALRHGNDLPVCELYKDADADYADTSTQGPIVAFNIRNVHGGWIANTEVEKLATVRNVQLRTGGLCNPGGIATALQLEPWEIKRNFSAGYHCGVEGDVMHGKPTGVIRLSLGAMSTLQDVDYFIQFMEDYFVERHVLIVDSPPSPPRENDRWYVENMMVYPIKSCAGFRVPAQTPWHIRHEGLEWDREWCLVRPGSNAALSQKKHPRMALIRPTLDIVRGVMRVSYIDTSAGIDPITIPLSDNPSAYATGEISSIKPVIVCGDSVAARTYNSPAITRFFSQALGIACLLARFPISTTSGSSGRHAKAHLQSFQQRGKVVQQAHNIPGTFPDEAQARFLSSRPILLSNESPILIISRSSLNRLNEQIKSGGGKAVHAEVFRANIVVAEYHSSAPFFSQEPYAEDQWRSVQIGRQFFDLLGGCARCQMVCIDQDTAKRSPEPFSTLAKTRRLDGKVYFGQHAVHITLPGDESADAQRPTITVGDHISPLLSDST